MEEFELDPDNLRQEILWVSALKVHSREANHISFKRVFEHWLNGGHGLRGNNLLKAVVCNQVKRLLPFIILLVFNLVEK